MPYVNYAEKERDRALRRLKKRAMGATTRINERGWLVVSWPRDENATIVIKHPLEIQAFKRKYPDLRLPQSLYWEALDYSKAKNRQLRKQFEGQL
jgi:hypothetical protein